jgi:hypothetical protein
MAIKIKALHPDLSTPPRIRLLMFLIGVFSAARGVVALLAPQPRVPTLDVWLSMTGAAICWVGAIGSLIHERKHRPSSNVRP